MNAGFLNFLKNYLLPVGGVVAGGELAFTLFAIAFNVAGSRAIYESLMPLGLAALASFILALANPVKWWVLAISVVLPTLLMSAVLLAALLLEGRGKGGLIWLAIAAAMLALCMAASWAARKIR